MNTQKLASATRRILKRALPPSVRSALKTFVNGQPQAQQNPLTLSKEQAAEVSRLMASTKAHLIAHRHRDALKSAELALRVDPTSQGALRARLAALTSLRDTRAAKAAAKQLVFEHPLDPVGYRSLKSLGLPVPSRSLKIARSEVRRMKGTAAAYLQASNYLHDAELHEEDALILGDGLRVAEALPPSPRREKYIANLNLNVGRNFEAKHDYKSAMSAYQLLQGTTYQEQGLRNIARCLHELGQHQEAYRRLISAGENLPQAPFTTLDLEVMQASGHVGEAFLLYRRRPISQGIAELFGQPDPRTIKVLSQEFKTKKVLLIAEGGPGDELRMASAYRDFAEHFGELTITCDPRLQGALKRTFPEITFIPVTRHRKEYLKRVKDRKRVPNPLIQPCVSDLAVDYGRRVDYVASVLDVIGEFRHTRADFRSSSPSPLKANANLLSRYAQRTASAKPKVGLAWRSMLQSVARNRHYLTVEQLRPLEALRDRVDFWLLQPNATSAELAALASIIDVKSAKIDLVDDFESQMALTANLDFVISPFTTTGELSGAMGVPTALLSTVASTTWRKNPDGSDIWHSSTMIATGEPLHDKRAACQAAVDLIQAHLLD